MQFIHVIERGWMELSSGPLNRIRFGRGELFFYEDLVDGTECHSRDATAVTPVSLFRLSRTNFLALIHRHPTLVLQLLSKQHSRLRGSSGLMRVTSTDWCLEGAEGCGSPWRPERS